MHDWKGYVREQLDDLRLDPRVAEEVISEFAGHLEDTYEQAMACGLSEADALRQCEEQLVQARQLARTIGNSKRKENAMNYRTKTLWLPALMTLTVSSVALMIAQLVSQQTAFAQSKLGSLENATALAFYIPWLLTLPFCGAAGAYLSRRSGGKRLSRLAAAVFPAIMMLAVLCLILPIGIFVERNTFIIHHLSYFAIAVLIWTVVPGAALFLGGAPFLAKRAEAS